jgi:hypothetical protein
VNFKGLILKAWCLIGDLMKLYIQWTVNEVQRINVIWELFVNVLMHVNR